MAEENGNGSRYDPPNRKLLEETHSKVDRLYACILGEPGTADKGLVGEFQQFQAQMTSKYNRLRTIIYTLILLLVAAGVLDLSGVLPLF